MSVFSHKKFQRIHEMAIPKFESVNGLKEEGVNVANLLHLEMIDPY